MSEATLTIKSVDRQDDVDSRIDFSKRRFVIDSIAFLTFINASSLCAGQPGDDEPSKIKPEISYDSLLKERRKIFTKNTNSHKEVIWLRANTDSSLYYYLIDGALQDEQAFIFVSYWSDQQLISFTITKAKMYLREFRNSLKSQIYPNLRSNNIVNEISKRVWISREEYFSHLNTVFWLLEYSLDTYRNYKSWLSYLSKYANFRTEYEMQRRYWKVEFFQKDQDWKEVLAPWFEEVVKNLEPRYPRKELIAIFKEMDRLQNQDRSKIYNHAPLYFYCKVKPSYRQNRLIDQKAEDKAEEKKLKLILDFLWKYKKEFDDIEKKFDVSREIIAATLFMETRLWNQAIIDKYMTHSAFSVISVQISDLFVPIGVDPKSLFKKWLTHENRIKKLNKRAVWYLAWLIKQAYKNKQNILSFKSNNVWAMWITQFMPNKFKYWHDWNWDWKLDLYNMVDAIYSVASFYSMNNWWSEMVLSNSRKSLLRKIKVYNWARYARQVYWLARLIKDAR